MNRQLAVRLGTLIGLILAAFFIYMIRQIIYIFISGMVLAYLLYPLVEHFSRRNMPKLLPIILSYAIFSAVLACLIFILIPRLYGESQSLTAALPIYTEMIVQYFQNLSAGFGLFLQNTGLEDFSMNITMLLQDKVTVFTEKTMAYILSLPQLVLYILLAPVLSFYFLRDHKKISASFLQVFPPEKRSEISILGESIDMALKGFIKGNLLVAVIVGLISGIGLFFLDLEYSMTLGAFVGIFNLIPYFGPFLGAIPVIIIAILTPGSKIIFILFFLFFVQQIENIFISPKIIGEQVGLHPLAIIFFVLIGGYAGGLFGMLFIIPFAAVGKILIKYLYEKIVAFSID